MFFSIIVPVYKVEKYLNQCVDSILGQTFNDFELILVDDGSPDMSGVICDEYSKVDERVKVIHKENSGAADSRNVGLNVSNGEYIVYIDSDDYIADENFLEKLKNASMSSPDIILYNYKKLYENTGTVSDTFFKYPQINEFDNRATILRKLVQADAFYCTAWLKAIKSILLKKNNIEFHLGIKSEDQEWYYHVVLLAQKYTVIDEPFVVYRQREGSVTATFGEQHLLDTITLLDGWCNRLNYSTIEDDFKNAIYGSLAKLYANLLIAFSSLEGAIQKKYLDELESLSWLIKYDLNPRVKKIKMFYKVVGLKGTIYLLSIARKLKR